MFCFYQRKNPFVICSNSGKMNCILYIYCYFYYSIRMILFCSDCLSNIFLKHFIIKMFYVAFSSVINQKHPLAFNWSFIWCLKKNWLTMGHQKNYKADHIVIITAAVLWLWDCRYGVGHQLFNRSIIFERNALDI